MDNECKGPDCTRKAVARGLCAAHHKQLMHDKPLTPLRKYRPRPEAPEGYAFCNECKTFKAMDEFYKTQDGKPRFRCKKCQAEYLRQHNERKKVGVNAN